MSPTRREVIQSAGAIAVALVLPEAVPSIAPVMAVPAPTVECCLSLCRKGRFSTLTAVTGQAPLLSHSATSSNGKTYGWDNPLSPEASRIWRDCLAQIERILDIQENHA